MMEKTLIEGTEIEQGAMPETEESSLISLEKLDRASPDLWPEHGITKFVTHNDNSSTLTSASTTASISASVSQSLQQVEVPVWSLNFTTEDINQIHQLGNLTVHELIAEVKKLHDTAYQLGLEEAKEMTRGKFLNIFKQEAKE